MTRLALSPPLPLPLSNFSLSLSLSPSLSHSLPPSLPPSLSLSFSLSLSLSPLSLSRAHCARVQRVEHETRRHVLFDTQATRRRMVSGPHALLCSGRCCRGLGAGQLYFKRRRQTCTGRHQAVTSAHCAHFTQGAPLVSAAWHRSLLVCVLVSVARTAFCVQAVHMYIYVVLVCARTPHTHTRMIEAPSEKRIRVDPYSPRRQHPDGRISQDSFMGGRGVGMAEDRESSLSSVR